MMFILLTLIFIALVFAFTSSSGWVAPPRPKEKREWGWEDWPRHEIHPAALAAMERAGHPVETSYVQVADVGVLAYRNTDDPKIVRSGDVLLDMRYLRPFAELWLPYAAAGAIRFSLTDGDGRVRYSNERRYDLKRGLNTVLPDTWLPLEGKAIDPGDEWTLQVAASNTRLAVHPFGWQPVGGGEIRRYMAGDGELSPALQDALRRGAHEAVSLSSLLADQEES